LEVVLTSAAIIIVIISAFIHALWNLVGKRESPSPGFFLQATVLGCLCLVPVVFVHLGVVRVFPGRVWWLLVGTGLCQAAYYTGLAGAYRCGHLSVAYPLARSLPVIMVAVVSALLGHGKQFGGAVIVGFGLIVVGGMVLPIDRLSEWKLRDYLHASTLFALLAAAGTTGYSIIDDAALRLLRANPNVHVGRAWLTLVYTLLEGLSSTVWLAVMMRVMRGINGSAKPRHYKLSSVAFAGIGIYLAYSLVLLAMTFATNVSYIVAFRQLSIPIGAALGMTVLREPRDPAKLLGIAIMLAGLLMVAGGR